MAGLKTGKGNQGFSPLNIVLNSFYFCNFYPAPMPYTRMLVHAVWATKNRRKLLGPEHRRRLFEHIRENAAAKNIHLLEVNGHTNHVHCLISLEPDQNIATLMQLLKGESSHWANKNLDFPEKFGWQEEYFAVSVSQSHFEAVGTYIRNQESHHSKKTFEQEYQEFLDKYGFED